MNVEIGAEAPQFPEKEYINRIAIAVQMCTFPTEGMLNYLRAFFSPSS
jgi:hypothetical protein